MYALNYLHTEMHAEFHEQSIKAFMASAETWECPNGCATCAAHWVTIDIKHTPSYPHVECPHCTGRFCAGCREEWHEGKTCQQYRVEYPELLTDDEVAVIEEMATLGARRCPQCQYIIVKDGGCEHMVCEQCYEDFDWGQAEKVRSLQAAPSSKTEEVEPSNENEPEVAADEPADELPPDNAPLTWAQHLRPAVPEIDNREGMPLEPELEPELELVYENLERRRAAEVHDDCEHAEDDEFIYGYEPPEDDEFVYDDGDDDDDDYPDDRELEPVKRDCEMDLIAAKSVGAAA
jgi:DNA-directed RNA polymerase subunit RPC12/RpoP